MPRKTTQQTLAASPSYHQGLVNEAKKAIDRMFADTSVSRDETRNSVKEIIGYCSELFGAIDEDKDERWPEEEEDGDTDRRASRRSSK